MELSPESSMASSSASVTPEIHREIFALEEALEAAARNELTAEQYCYKKLNSSDTEDEIKRQKRQRKNLRPPRTKKNAPVKFRTFNPEKDTWSGRWCAFRQRFLQRR